MMSGAPSTLPKRTGRKKKKRPSLVSVLFPEEAYAGFRTSRREDIFLLLGGFAAGCLMGLLFYRDPKALVLSGPVSYLALRLGRRKIAGKRRETLRRQLRDYLVSVVSFLRAGFALENAMRGAEGELMTMYGADSLMGQEAAAMSRQLSLQIPPEKLWREFGERCRLPEGAQLAKVFAVAKRQGGDYLPVLKAMAQMMDKDFALRSEISVMLTGKRLEYYLMCLIPALMIVYLDISAPDMTRSLFEGSGPVFMSLFLLFYALAVWWGDRILEKAYEA